jgi:hypothetical protein
MLLHILVTLKCLSKNETLSLFRVILLLGRPCLCTRRMCVLNSWAHVYGTEQSKQYFILYCILPSANNVIKLAEWLNLTYIFDTIIVFLDIIHLHIYI